MLALGHAGITLGAVLVLQSKLRRKSDNTTNGGSTPPVGFVVSFINGIDLRILLLGSLLPDIIDKPIGLVIFRESISYGRIYAHTLLFLLFAALTGLMLYRLKGRRWLLVLAAGTASHLILDGMWTTPVVLFWPLLGTTFPRQDVSNYFLQMLEDLRTQPDVLIGEIIGIIVTFAIGIIRLKKKKGFRNFICKGQIL